jgi:hypothetical protein
MVSQPFPGPLIFGQCRTQYLSALCLSERQDHFITWRSVTLPFLCMGDDACGDANACKSGSDEP